MFENLKSMTDDEVINVINNIVTDNMDVALADLKIILAEASGRKLEKKYINIIAERIKSKIQPEVVEIKRRSEPVKPTPEPKQDLTKTQAVQKPTFDDVYNASEDEEVFEEEYGSNWKEIWNKRYQDDLAEKKAKKEAELAKAMENPPIIYKFKIGDMVRCKEDPTPRKVVAIQDDCYKIEGSVIPFEEDNKWYHCYEQFKNYW